MRFNSIVIFLNTRCAQELTELAAGATLNAGQTLKSPSGQSKLVLQGDGNLVVRIPPSFPWGN